MPPRNLLLDTGAAALTTLLDAVGDGAWEWEPGSDVMLCSEAWLRICGLEVTRGPAVFLWRDRIHPEDRTAVAAAIDDLCCGRTRRLFSEYRLLMAAGGYRPVLMRGAVLRRDESDRPRTLAGTFTDLSDRRQLEESVRRLSSGDSLTGLRNRRAFLEAAESERLRVRRYGGALSLILADIDGFRRINDAFGHAAGDAVLCRVARCLEAALRKTDVVGRVGGEEFAVLLPETEGARAGMVAESLRQAIADASVPGPGGEAVAVTASFGVACLGGETDGVADLLQRADAALCDAKRLGRNRVCRPAG